MHDMDRVEEDIKTALQLDYQVAPSVVLQLGRLHLRSRGGAFNSWSGRYQVVNTWMGDCLRAGKLSSYVYYQTNTKANSVFHLWDR